MIQKKWIRVISIAVAVTLLTLLFGGIVLGQSGETPHNTDYWSLEVAAGGIFVVMVLKETYALIKTLLSKKQEKDNDRCSECMECLKSIQHQVDDLYTWHDMRDPTNGVFVWYGSLGMTQLREAINSLAESARAQTDILRELTKGVSQNSNQIRDQGQAIARIEMKVNQ